MEKNNSIADPFGLDDICEDGLYLVGYEGEKPELDFDLRKAARYIRENNLPELTEEIMEMFKK